MKYTGTIFFICAANTVYALLTKQLGNVLTNKFHSSSVFEHHIQRKLRLLWLAENDNIELSGPELLPPQIASNFGSDVLFRPDDEDSPEFREYLRQLLKMQANRAKAGHASPSSGSADAYVAKLTRLKIEKNARLRVGLPNIALDLSYKPEDYTAAVYEGQEPVISSSTGLVAVDPRQGRSSGSAKVRPLTDEELALSRVAEENVKRALEQRLKQQLDGIEPIDAEFSPRAPPLSRLGLPKGEDDLLIDQLLGSAKSPPNPAQKQAQKQQQIQQTIQQQTAKRQAAVELPTPSQPPKQKQQPPGSSIKLVEAVAKQSPQQVQTQPKQQQSKQSPQQTQPAPKQQQQNQQQKNQQQQAIAPAAQNKPASPQPSVPSRPAAATVQLKRKLEAPEVEVVGKALQLLVKHRGGGPFGAGRLVDSEADDLAVALQQVVQLFEQDSKLAEPVKVVSQIKKEVVPLPQLPTLPVVSTPPAPAAVAQKKPVPVKTVSQQSTPQVVSNVRSEPTPQQAPLPAAAAEGPVPIALGLDKFLQDPKQFQIEELAALRDGIIQCLGLIQSELTSASSQPRPASPAKASPQVAAALSEESLPLDKELKQTLGLLLKHRGGPGFGHGRLQGSELELLEQKLLSVSSKLAAEAESAAAQSEEN